MTARVLVVEDDPVSRHLLTRLLEVEGHRAVAASTYREAVALIDRETFDLVLLDLMLADGDGLALCRRVRQRQRRTPVIIITARGESADVVTGLELGADDYVVKPFHVDVLAARVRAQLRRAAEARADDRGEPIRIEGLVIDPAIRDAFVREQRAGLTNKEFELLHLLARRRGRAVPKEEILDHLFEGEVRSEKILAVYIRRLRRKIEADPDRPEFLHTVRGFGYRLGPSPMQA
ncbi:MAG TPA: response regulator transcription factor [Thermoanaerobaculia bacterium]|nr:response regulator transcription factor [Thermoanaerobaculia bacterium]